MKVLIAAVANANRSFRSPQKCVGNHDIRVPHPKRDLHPKTVRSIYRQAGLKEPR
jgi:predicted RNA binding protein YcfA (HicA-like mRNA interferase family)